MLAVLLPWPWAARAKPSRSMRFGWSDGEGRFRFSPSPVSAKRGDVLLFKAVSGTPHSVVFEGKDLAPAAHQALNGALPRRAGDLSSPLLTQGAEYRIVVPALPAGSYEFFCLPHRAYDMRGVLMIDRGVLEGLQGPSVKLGPCFSRGYALVATHTTSI